MILLILFAFIAGMVTILSPCILPILPIVLSGSLTGGKRRPLGIVAGFILSFTFFTLFLSTLVRLTGISADFLRQFSIVIILLFGTSMLIPQFQIWMERLFSRLASTSPKTNSEAGFVGGILVGVSLGLVWTPCVGPILASVISLALTGSVNGSAFIITLAYSFGTAIPMLAITYGGRQLLQKVPWLLTRSATIQKVFGILMITTAISMYFNIDRQFQSYILQTFPSYGIGLTKIEDNQAVKQAIERFQKKPIDDSQKGKPMYEVMPTDLGAAPDLIPGGQWFNVPEGEAGLTMNKLRGKVVLVDFWTYTCINCIRTLPYITSWWEKYKDKGLVIIGVHTPEFEFEKNAENVEKAMKDFGITYPVMQDNDYATWRAYNNHYWPAKYFIDKNGRIRYTHFGEGDYDESEAIIQKLLAETGTTISEKPNNPTYEVYSRTPETYLGYQRIDGIISPEHIVPDQSSAYTIPQKILPNTFGFGGTWTVGRERAMPKKGARLVLGFDASEVFLVMRPVSETTGEIKVSLDGVVVSTKTSGADVTQGTVVVESDRLYKLIKLPTPGQHLLQLDFLDDNVELYAFTFG